MASLLEELQKPAFRCTLTHLKQAGEQSVGVLRLLLLHPTCEPHELLPWAIKEGKNAVVIALLESRGIVFQSRQDPAMMACCESDNACIAQLILRDPRFSPGESAYEYTLHAVEKCSLTVLGVLQTAAEFFPLKRYREIIQKGCDTGNVIIFGVLLNVLGVCEWTLTRCAASGFVNLFDTALQKYTSNGSNVSLIVASACTDDNKIAMFRLMVSHLKEKDLWKVYFQSAERGSIPQLSCLLNSRRLAISPRLLSIDLTKGTMCLEYLLKERNIPVCASDEGYASSEQSRGYASSEQSRGCALSLSCVHCEEDVVSLLLKYSEGCEHIEGLLPRVIDLGYFAVAQEMVKKLRDNIKDSTVLAVLQSGNGPLIEALLGRLKNIREEIVLLCLYPEHLEAVQAVSRRFRLNFSWNSYALLKAAARDKTNTSFQALGL